MSKTATTVKRLRDSLNKCSARENRKIARLRAILYTNVPISNKHCKSRCPSFLFCAGHRVVEMLIS
jgi:hypothetical protein